MIPKTATLTALVWLAGSPPLPAAGPSDTIVQLARSLEPMANRADVEGLEATCDQLAEQNRDKPTDEGRYALAYCRYRIASLLIGQGEGSEIGPLLVAAQDELEGVLEEVPEGSRRAVEAMSLLAGVMGLRIGLQPGLGMKLGPPSGRLLSQAESIDPENPRVHLQIGIAKMNTPKMWGGSRRRAEAALRKAVSIFAAQSADAPWPSWGTLDALAWLGQALAAQDKIDEARAIYQQALAIDPEMGWVRYQLLPMLESKAASQ